MPSIGGFRIASSDLGKVNVAFAEESTVEFTQDEATLKGYPVGAPSARPASRSTSLSFSAVNGFSNTRFAPNVRASFR